MNGVDGEGDASEKKFHVEGLWHQLSTHRHEEHGNDGVQGNVDDVVSIRRQTTHEVVYSDTIHKLAITNCFGINRQANVKQLKTTGKDICVHTVQYTFILRIYIKKLCHY